MTYISKIIISHKQEFSRECWTKSEEIQQLMHNLAYIGCKVVLNCEPVTREWYLEVLFGFDWHPRDYQKQIEDLLEPLRSNYSVSQSHAVNNLSEL